VVAYLTGALLVILFKVVAINLKAIPGFFELVGFEFAAAFYPEFDFSG
jgi:hypothetical protein